MIILDVLVDYSFQYGYLNEINNASARLFKAAYIIIRPRGLVCYAIHRIPMRALTFLLRVNKTCRARYYKQWFVKLLM